MAGMLPRPCVSANIVIFGGVIIFFGGVTPAEGRYSPARAVRLSSTARGMEYIRTLAPNRSLRCWSHSRSSQQPDARLTPPNHHWEDGILGPRIYVYEQEGPKAPFMTLPFLSFPFLTTNASEGSRTTFPPPNLPLSSRLFWLS